MPVTITIMLVTFTRRRRAASFGISPMLLSPALSTCSEQAHTISSLQCRAEALHLEAEHLRTLLAAYHRSSIQVVPPAAASGHSMQVGDMPPTEWSYAASSRLKPSAVSEAERSRSCRTDSVMSSSKSSPEAASMQKELSELRGRHDAALKEIAAMHSHVRVLPSFASPALPLRERADAASSAAAATFAGQPLSRGVESSAALTHRRRHEHVAWSAPHPAATE